MFRWLRIGILVGLVAFCAATAYANNLVQNGGFETGDFTSWALSGDTSAAFVTSVNPHSGNFSAQLGTTSGTGYLSQTLSHATPGQPYVLSFWLASDGQLPNSFAITFDGNTLDTLLNVTPGYSLYQYTVAPTTSTPTLQFAFDDTNGSFYLDDVGLNATPEADSLAGFGALVVVGSVWALRIRKGKRRPYPA